MSEGATVRVQGCSVSRLRRQRHPTSKDARDAGEGAAAAARVLSLTHSCCCCSTTAEVHSLRFLLSSFRSREQRGSAHGKCCCRDALQQLLCLSGSSRVILLTQRRLLLQQSLSLQTRASGTPSHSHRRRRLQHLPVSLRRRCTRCTEGKRTASAKRDTHTHAHSQSSSRKPGVARREKRE